MAQFHVFRVGVGEVSIDDPGATQLTPGFYWQITTPADTPESSESDVCHGPFGTETLATFDGQDRGHVRWA